MSVTWGQFTSIPNGTRIYNHFFDQCVALANHYHENVIGGKFIAVGSAHQWWNTQNAEINRLYTRSNTPVAGAIFVSLGGIYDRTHGHIGIVTGVNANGTFTTMEQNAGTWRYTGRYTRGMANILGFLIPKKNPAVTALEPHQRRVGSNPANRRNGPSTSAAIINPQLAPGVVGNFDGWIRGEQVSDSVASTNIWYRGISGDWFWAGSFTTQSTAGLKDLNTPKPPAVQAHQRQVDPVPVNVRDQASTAGKIVGSLAANAIVTPEGWITGQSVQGISFWYKIDDGWAWAGGFTREDAAGLKDLNSSKPTPVEPIEPEDPTGPGDNTGPGPVLSSIDDWDASAPNWGEVWPRPEPATVNMPLADNIVETAQRPIGGYYVGRSGAPNHIVLHHADGANLDGVVNHLMGSSGAPTANWVVKDDRVVGMVDERDTPSTNTRWRSNQYSVTIEVCNDGTRDGKPSAASHEATAWVVARTALRWGMRTPLEYMVNVFGHKDVSKSPTACPGDLDVGWIISRANDIMESYVSGEEPTVPDTPSDELTEVLELTQKLYADFNKIFRLEN